MSNKPNRRRALANVPAGNTSPRWRSANPFTLVVGGLVALAVVVGVVVAMGGDDTDESTAKATAPVTISGEPLAPFDSATGDSARGSTAPEMSGSALDGTPLSFTNGTPRAVIFLAHWCPHCQAEVEALTAFFATTPPAEGVSIETVSTLVDARRGNFPPKTWLEREGWPFPVLADDEDDSVAGAFGLTGTPFWIFVDADGRVVERVSGEIDPSVVGAALERLAGGHRAGDGSLLVIRPPA